MLIFIENTPRAYAWGSTDALAKLLGTTPTGQPEAELWLGTHESDPAHIAKATPVEHTLLDLVVGDPERYGVDGGPLPFLLKVLAIGAPLSLQVHPNREQAAAGFAAEEAAGVPEGAAERNYGDGNHKPELLVALSEVTALSGFRPLLAARDDFAVLAEHIRSIGDDAAAAALDAVIGHLVGADDAAVRMAFLDWVFTGDPVVAAAIDGLAALVTQPDSSAGQDEDVVLDRVSAERVASLRALVEAHPGDPGVLVAMLLHVVRLAPGEAVFLQPRQLHAYLSGIAVEVMAASDNVLRAGLTEKHVDVTELCRVVDPAELSDPRFAAERCAPGLIAWRPDVPDFELLRARVCDPDRMSDSVCCPGECAAEVELTATRPLVLVVTAGRVRVERPTAELAEVATAKHGQSLYVSAGEPIRLSGHGEVFCATVGSAWDRDGSPGPAPLSAS